MFACLVFALFFQAKQPAAESGVIFKTDGFDLVGMDVDEKYIVLLKRAAPFVQVLNSEGNVLMEWGKPGQGPNAFTTARDICLVGDQVWVLNIVPNKVTVFSLNGTYMNSTKLDEIFWLTRLENLGGKPIVEGGDWLSSTRTLYLLNDKQKTSIATIDIGRMEQLKPKSGPLLNIESAFPDKDIWAIYNGNRLVVRRKQSSDLVIHPNEHWHLNSQIFKVPTSAQEEWLKRVLPGIDLVRFADVDWVQQAKALPIPGVFPKALTVLADDDRLWVLRAFRKNDQYWECYVQGTKTRSLALPAGFKVLQFHKNRVYAVDLDSDDQFFVAYSFWQDNREYFFFKPYLDHHSDYEISVFKYGPDGEEMVQALQARP